MAAINDLIAQIENPELRARIQAEVDRMNKQKKFGLVFEEHLPECTPLYDIPVKRGALVALKTGKVSEVYRVLKIKGDEAECKKKDADEIATFKVNELVTVAEFGDAIYPYLKPMDSVCNAPDSDLWHTLIEADNYHALQLLEYLYAGKVDCIYIDPPYNTGARDWKYNNDYVDGADTYRHSKWLSMMQKRLAVAKRLLNPTNSVLIVTIDEKNKDVRLTSLARDTYVDIEGYSTEKLTHAYAYEGPSLLLNTINKNFDIAIDKYVAVSFESFERIIDILGGVDINLSEKEVSQINGVKNSLVIPAEPRSKASCPFKPSAIFGNRPCKNCT